MTNALRHATEAGDGDAMAAGSLDALHERVRIAAAERDYCAAARLLELAEQRFPDVPARRRVSVAPDALGRDLPLDSDGASGLPGAGTFTIITPCQQRAAAVLSELAPKLMDVDELGAVQPLDAEHWDPDGEPVYTPSYLHPLACTQFVVQVRLDTDGEITAAMGRTMVAILAEGLAAARVPAHIAGCHPGLRGELKEYGVPLA